MEDIVIHHAHAVRTWKRINNVLEVLGNLLLFLLAQERWGRWTPPKLEEVIPREPIQQLAMERPDVETILHFMNTYVATYLPVGYRSMSVAVKCSALCHASAILTSVRLRHPTSHRPPGRQQRAICVIFFLSAALQAVTLRTPSLQSTTQQ
ncbi:unnamed protein product [Cuscuta campestris]|uniref:Uncharacterized protein n=1 Tax=Cuscuta campestris TaxID=132261 RepID=A0A484LTY6_9ASTE|nr:unnamed protein product [Cuscuta campestris]